MIWTHADVLNFKYRGAKMFLLKPCSDCQSFVKNQTTLKIQTESPRSEIFPLSRTGVATLLEELL